jgi:polyisoprenoid-binding protein YceI
VERPTIIDMKHKSLPAFLGLALAFAFSSAQAETHRFESSPGSTVKIEGTSTIHDWTVEGNSIAGHLEIDPAQLDSAMKEFKDMPKAEVIIPIRSLKSGKKRMDEVMQEAMHQKDHPKIEYRLIKLALKEAPKLATDPFQFDATGALTISGVTRTNSMPVTLQKVEGKKIRVVGKVPLKMTDFGIKPPAPEIALGLIKTGDDITISFDWLTAEPDAK